MCSTRRRSCVRWRGKSGHEATTPSTRGRCIDFTSLSIPTHRVMRLSVLALAFAPLAAGAQPRPSIATADQLVRAMHDRYAATWYHTLSFQQDAIRTMPDGSTTTQVWLEAADIPGR